MVFKKIIFQNSLMANETPSRPPPFMANAILNFHFDFPHPSLSRPWLKLDFLETIDGVLGWPRALEKDMRWQRHSSVGAISSDLYRPQSQDEIVEVSFFVALSYEYNLQLGCFWWKKSTSSLMAKAMTNCHFFLIPFLSWSLVKIFKLNFGQADVWSRSV